MSEEQVTGATATAAQPNPGTATGTGEPATYDKGDYLKRVEHEPEFAVSQVREKDKRITELQEKAKQYGGLDEYLSALGGVDGLKQYVDIAYQINQQEGLANIVTESLRTGQVPSFQTGTTGQETDDGEYVDPDVKSLRTELAELKASIESSSQVMNQRFAQADTRSFKTGIDANIQKVMDDFAVTSEIRESMKEEITKRVKEAESRASRGDQTSLNLLNSLSGAEGIDTLQMIVSPVINANIEAIAAARQKAAVDNAQSHATGEPGNARTAGGGTVSPKPNPYGNWVLEALEKNARSVGEDPQKMFDPMQ